jgi:hypothetical protein
VESLPRFNAALRSSHLLRAASDFETFAIIAEQIERARQDHAVRWLYPGWPFRQR